MFQLPKPALSTLQVVDKPIVKSQFMKVSPDTVRSNKILKTIQNEKLPERAEFPIYGLIAVIALLIIIRK